MTVLLKEKKIKTVHLRQEQGHTCQRGEIQMSDLHGRL